jgi:hypothetical protein
VKKALFRILLVLWPISLSNHALAAEIECYDAKVRAKPLAQIPTPFPNAPDYIVISWPWFLDLNVTRVLDGDVPQKEITVLAVLHTAYLNKTRTWLLRRNTLGTFNVLRVADPDSVLRCETDVEPVEPYIRPSEEKSLEDYRREGEEELRRYYDEDAE